MAVCPECRDEKHRNCGPALDETTDEIGPCRCVECAEEDRERLRVLAARHREYWEGA
jgi:hypothetical protein